MVWRNNQVPWAQSARSGFHISLVHLVKLFWFAGTTKCQRPWFGGTTKCHGPSQQGQGFIFLWSIWLNCSGLQEPPSASAGHVSEAWVWNIHLAISSCRKTLITVTLCRKSQMPMPRPGKLTYGTCFGSPPLFVSKHGFLTFRMRPLQISLKMQMKSVAYTSCDQWPWNVVPSETMPEANDDAEGQPKKRKVCMQWCL